ncbi:gamma-glutamylcyclotransferase family protein [Arhodomonas sp. SL1]|uniref:gamma-glutamylcyclotransferase family protein n=1 Tax=Arhodomonas sp. SL1 TaxID=3425691 RepID=UPI003F884257
MHERGTRRYFAYGSNLHPLRLGLRTPGCRLLGTAALPDYQLRFHKRSDGDGSAKADARHTGAGDDRVLGAVYEMRDDEIPVLDRIEGLGPGGYRVTTETVSLNGEALTVFLYVAVDSHIVPDWRPFAWYRDLVWHGARWQGFPADYVETIAAVQARPDPEPQRSADNRRLLEVMPDWRLEHGYRLEWQ